jgi:hypothetical protein
MYELKRFTQLLEREEIVISLKTALGTLINTRSSKYQTFQHYADSRSPQFELFNLTACNICKHFTDFLKDLWGYVIP